MNLTVLLDLDSIKMNQPVKYLDQRSFSAKVIVGTQTHMSDQLRHLDH